MAKFELTTSTAQSAWQDGPPGVLDEPTLYDGLVWRRSFGYLIDVCLIAVAMVAAWLVLGLLAILSLGLLLPVKIVVLALLPIAYHTWFVGNSGATPGMRAVDVEVRSWNGQRPDYFQAFLMTAMFYVTVGITAWLVLAVAFFNDRSRTLHDYLAGTLGVRRSRIVALMPQAA